MKLLHRAVAVTGIAVIALSSVHCHRELPNAAPSYRPYVIDPDLLGGIIEPVSGDYLVWGTDGTILRSPDGQTWQHAHTPVNTEISQISAAADRSTLMAVGKAGTILISSDGGYQWRLIDVPGVSVDLNTVIHLPGDNLWIAAGADGHILQSSDNGVQWQIAKTGTNDDFLTVSIMPDNKLLLGGDNGLIGVSTDKGNSWQLLRAQTETPVTSFHHFGGLTIGTSAWGRLVFSNDGADTWQLLQTEKMLYFNDAAFDPNHNSIVISSHNGHILHTSDAGKNWQLVEAPYQGTRNYLGDLFYDDHEKKLLVFGHYGTVLESSDGGKSWQDVVSPFRYSFNKVIYSEARKQYLGVGPRGFKAFSNDSATSWKKVQDSFDYYWREGAVSPSGAITVAGELGMMLRSEDGGSTWHYLDIHYRDPNTPPTYRALALEEKSGALIAAGPTGTIVRSTDDGRTWHTVHYTPFDSGEAFTHIVLDPARQTAFAVEAFGGPYFSSDGGATWERNTLGDSRNFWHGSILSTRAKSLALAVGQKGLIALSDNGGKNWRVVTAATVGNTDFYGCFASAKHLALFAFGDNGVMVRSSDYGASWQSVHSDTTATLRRMTPDADTDALIAFGEQGTIIRSTDGGLTWQKVESPVTAELRAALTEPETGNLVIVGRAGTVIRSNNGGDSWQKIPTHTTAHFRNAVFQPDTGELIAFGDRIVRLVPQ